MLFLLIKPSIRTLDRLGANEHPFSDRYQGHRSSYQYVTPPSRRAPIVSINDSSVNLKLSDANKPRVLGGQLPHRKTRSYGCEQQARAVDLEDKRGPSMPFSSVGESTRHRQSIPIYPVAESGDGFHRRESVRPKQEDKNVHGSTPLSHPWTVKCTPTVTNSFYYHLETRYASLSVPQDVSSGQSVNSTFHFTSRRACFLLFGAASAPLREKCLCLTATLWTFPSCSTCHGKACVFERNRAARS